MDEKIDCLREKEFWFLILSGLILFYRPLFGGETFYYRDLFLHFYPQKLHLLQSLQTREIPLWDPYVHGGQPFLADPNNAVLYPFHLLYVVFPFTFAFNLDIVLQILLCAAGAYWLARSLDFDPISSLVAGATFAFCGYTLSLANLYNRLAAQPYIPLLLACWHRYLLGGKQKWFLLTGLFGVVQFMAGSPETSILTFLLVLSWSMAYPFESSRIRRMTLSILMGILVAAGSAVQILPAWEMAQHSQRSLGGNFYSFTGWSLHPKRLPELILPHFLGGSYGISQSTYWGWRIEDLGYPFILSIYFGFLSILVALHGVRSRSRDSVLPYRVRVFLWVVFLLSVILSMGRNLFLFRWIYDLGGILTWFRYPIKILTLGILPLGLLGSAGISAFQRADKKADRWIIPALVIFVITLLVAISLLMQKSVAELVLAWYFQQSSEYARKGVLSSLLQSLLFSNVGLLFILHLRLRPATWKRRALAVCILVSLLLAGRQVNDYAPSSFFNETPNLVRRVRKGIGTGRLYRDSTPTNIVFQFPGNDFVYLARWRLELLDYYTASLYSIPIIFHEDYDQLAPEKISWLGERMRNLTWKEKSQLLSAANVTTVLTAEQLQISNMELLAVVRNSSNIPFYLYRNTEALAPVNFFSSWIPASSREEAFAKLSQPEFQPSRTVLVNEDRQEKTTCTADVKIEQLDSRTTVSHHRIVSKCDGYLVYTETNYPGWQVRVDGIPAPIQDANVAFSAVFLKAGEHFVERKYSPRSVYVGFTISLLTLILTLLLAPRIKAVPENRRIKEGSSQKQ